MASNKPFIPGSSIAPAGVGGVGNRQLPGRAEPFIPGQLRIQAEAHAPVPPDRETEIELPLITEFLAQAPVHAAPMAGTQAPAAEPVGYSPPPVADEQLPSILDFVVSPAATLAEASQVEEPQGSTTPDVETVSATSYAPLADVTEPAEEGAPVLEAYELSSQAPEQVSMVEAPVIEPPAAAAFVPSELPPVADAAPPEAPAVEETWVHDEWKKFDWNSAAAIGPGRGEDREAAESAWAETDWEDAGLTKEARAKRAEAMASALNKVAEKIREGTLRVNTPRAETEEAALAAALAALLGKKTPA